MRTLLFIAILLPQIATAGVFMCVDPTTGKKSFTDRACPSSETGAPVKVEPTNFGTGEHRREHQSSQKAWHSQRDTTVSGPANYLDKTTAVNEPARPAISSVSEASS